MAHWEEVQTKAKKLIEEGLVLLRSGAKEAEFIAGTTAVAARLQVKVSKNRYELYRALHDLGQLTVTEAIKSGSDSIKTNAKMKSLIKRANDIEEASKRAEKELSKFTIIDKKKPRAKTKTKTKAKTKTKTKTTSKE